MTYKKVALISLPRQDLIRPPAAIPILAAACEEKNIDYDFFDLNLWLYRSIDHRHWIDIDDNWIKISSQFDESRPWVSHFRRELENFKDHILSTGPDLIAISVFTDWSAHCAWELIDLLNKSADRDKFQIVIGGTGICAKLSWLTNNDAPLCEFLLRQNLIDFYLYGEGEIIFRKLLDHDLNHAGINNLDHHQIDDLDQFPMASYRKVRPEDYDYIGAPSVIINGSRGCVRKCTYCDVAKYWPKYRYRSGANLAQEIFHVWQQTGVTKFEFSDSLINGSLREFRALNQTLIQLRNKNPDFDIAYQGQFICRDANQFKESDYRDMKMAGCCYIYVGVESFSEKVRMSMDKKFDNRALEFHLEMCGKYLIPNTFLMIVGYPTETQEDHKINVEGLKKYQRYSQAGVIEMITWGFTTAILEDTPLHAQMADLSIVPEFLNFDQPTNWVSLKNSGLTFRERARRWLELTELSNELGYNQTRLNAIVNRLGQVLDQTGKLQTNPRVFEILPS